MIDETGGLRLMKAYWVIIEVSEGLGGWMGIRGRLEGRRRDWEWFTLSVYPILPNHSIHINPFIPAKTVQSPYRSISNPLPVPRSCHTSTASSCHVSSFLPSMVCVLLMNSRLGNTRTVYALRVHGWYIGY